jgi:hypothetical protein
VQLAAGVDYRRETYELQRFGGGSRDQFAGDLQLAAFDNVNALTPKHPRP